MKYARNTKNGKTLKGNINEERKIKMNLCKELCNQAKKNDEETQETLAEMVADVLSDVFRDEATVTVETKHY